MRRWRSGIKPLEINLSKVPVWLHLKGVPLELFNRDGLSYIASVIGKPLCMDPATAARKRLTFAKVCIEMEAGKEIPEHVKVVMRDGSITLIAVEVPWSPTKCTKCNSFGHTVKTCNKQEKKIWQVKKTAQGTENLPSSARKSMTQDENDISPQRVSGDLLSSGPQGDNGRSPRQTDRVMPSSAVIRSPSLSKNGYSSPGGDLLKNVDEMVHLLSKSKEKSPPKTGIATVNPVNINKFDILNKFDDDATVVNEVLVEDDDELLIADVPVVNDPLVGMVNTTKSARKVRAASEGVKIAIQNHKGNQRKSKKKMKAGSIPASGSFISNH